MFSEKVAVNNEFEVLTPSGWSNFRGVKQSKTDVLFTLTFEDNTKLKCTENHLIKYPTGEFLEASQILIGDELFGGKIVKDISWEFGTFEVYDLIDVECSNEYLTNEVVSHNCAFISDIEEIWASSQMTLATGGKCIMLSTPNGIGGLFHRVWQQAEEGTVIDGIDKFHPIMLPWYLHPDRDQTWRDQQDQLLGKRLASQECDANFLSSGHTVIESEILQWYEKEQVMEPIERRGIGGDLWIFKYADLTRTYIVCADVARGDGEDYSAFHVIDVETVEQVAEFKGKIDTQMFGNLLVSISTEYNNALLIIDNRNIGWSTIQVVIDSGYKNLYYSYKNDPYLDENIHLRKAYDLKQKEDMIPGYSITVKSRPVLISKLDIYFRERSPIIHSKRLLNELYVFMWIDSKPQAQKGYNDDLVMALCMGLMIRDTSLKLRMLGIDMIKRTLTNTHKSLFKPQPIGSDRWQMNTGKAGQQESLKWLL